MDFRHGAAVAHAVARQSCFAPKSAGVGSHKFGLPRHPRGRGLHVLHHGNRPSGLQRHILCPQARWDGDHHLRGELAPATAGVFKLEFNRMRTQFQAQHTGVGFQVDRVVKRGMKCIGQSLCAPSDAVRRG